MNPPPPSRRFRRSFSPEPPAQSSQPDIPRPRWGWIELFVLVQLLSPALLFIPGAQAFRFIIRSLPYVTSGAMLLFLFLQNRQPHPHTPGVFAPRPVAVPARPWIIGCIGLLLVCQVHPDTVQPAGMAQVIFQIAIVAPLFWGPKLVPSEAHLSRIIWLFLLCNAASSLVGLLQVFLPDRFLPPEFSRVGLELDPYWVESLSYTGAAGQRIIRPPGLTDMPGGASLSGMSVGFLGIVLGLQAGCPALLRILSFGLAAIGMAVLYLTQVRSLFLMMLVILGGMAALSWKRDHARLGAALVVSAALLVAGTFQWASSIGGEAVSSRFLSLKDDDPLQTYKRNRGHFLHYTATELLAEHPFGAGVGRWGMMNVYFKPADPLAPQPIHAEIQLTGWLIDGGVLMWMLYGGAILACMIPLGRIAIQREAPNLGFLAGIAFCINLGIIVQSFAGPSFNTQLGIQFWFLAAATFGAWHGHQTSQTTAPDEPSPSDPLEPAPSRNWRARRRSSPPPEP